LTNKNKCDTIFTLSKKARMSEKTGDNMETGERKEILALFEAISKIKNVDECREFLNDLCTSVEIEEMSRRWKAAQMLKNGYQYADVVEQTGLSTATISRVSRALKNGQGYQRMLSRMGSEE
jgi:TrpR-related protein YerC/YecD